MRIAAAVLCDAANVREGLANVLSAGISRVFRSDYPAPLGVTLFYLIEVDESEVKDGAARKIAVEIRQVSYGAMDAEPVVRIDGGLELAGLQDVPGLPSYVPLIVGLSQVAISRPADYVLTVELEGLEPRELRFRVEVPPPVPEDGSSSEA